VLSEKGASLQAEKQAFYFMVLSLEEVKEELIITEELLRQAQANNAELKAKKALLERDLEEQANQNKEAQTFKTTLAETQKEKAIVAQEKAKAAEQNNSSLSALNLANQAVIAKQQAVENLDEHVREQTSTYDLAGHTVMVYTGTDRDTRAVRVVDLGDVRLIVTGAATDAQFNDLLTRTIATDPIPVER